MTAPSVLRRKPIEDFGSHESGLNRSLSMMQLALIGVGSTIGTGIFFIFETTVPKAGPGIVLSFLLASLVAGFTALCYAELASTLPASGSSYSYAYAAMGEIVACGVAVMLMLEYGVSAAAVSVGWSEYIDVLLEDTVGLQIPEWAAHAPSAAGFGVNLPAVILVVICGLLLSQGASESAKVNAVMVTVNLSILLFFVVVAARGFQIGHFTPFMPNGWAGVASAGGSVFFTFVGLDAICTAGEEVKNPQKNIPRALLVALSIVTIVYALVALTAVGAQDWQLFGTQRAALAVIVENILNASWPAELLAICAIISIFSCTLVTLFGQTRILYAMSRDGMVPKTFQKVNAKHVPLKNIWIVVSACAVMAAFANLSFLADLASMGTLLIYSVVSLGVIVMRHTEPDRPRGFTVPGYPVLPIIAILSCVYLISQMSPTTWLGCGILLAAGAVFYFTYSRKHSSLNQRLDATHDASLAGEEGRTGVDLESGIEVESGLPMDFGERLGGRDQIIAS